MHIQSFALAFLATITPLAYAVGSAIVFNNCECNVYLWSVGSAVGPSQTLTPGQSYSEYFHLDPVSGGIALKVTLAQNGLYTGAPETIFAYRLDGTGVWYDLSDVFGDGFAGEAVTILPSIKGCSAIEWADGIPPSGSQVNVCGASTNLTLVLCK
ncbi:hypothetical protein K432DRAFT_379464 [Lepidopterella palustris CBS 459.81]|uniref:Bys1 family protein n=1 Tax=Lepidopterella palustris CBS 459.81 TaxID=1314670 RepID=A0A8E2EG92_9PEZI|nr:hypothetical protein K432DRAFT_379464 [Lepidopterella palustris CBS 459.81]